MTAMSQTSPGASPPAADANDVVFGCIGADGGAHIKEAAGDLTDDKDLENEGKVDKAAGNVKDTVGDAADKAKDVVGKD